MKKVKINPLFSILTAIGNEQLVERTRKTAITTEINGVVIDTVRAFDTGLWETAIMANNPWVIVEIYKNYTEAKIGHNKWCDCVKMGKRNFKDVLN